MLGVVLERRVDLGQCARPWLGRCYGAWTRGRGAAANVKMKRIKKLREEAQKCVRVADRTADNKVAAALLAYACQLEQRARLIESAKQPRRATLTP
jgi:hypothetical protein